MLLTTELEYETFAGKILSMPLKCEFSNLWMSKTHLYNLLSGVVTLNIYLPPTCK